MNNDTNKTTTTNTTTQIMLGVDHNDDHIIDIDTTQINQKRGFESDVKDQHEVFDDHTQKVSKIDQGTQRPTQRVIDANYIICQLLMSADLFQKLGVKSVLNLSLTSKTVSNVIRTFINEHILFNFHSNTKYQIYQPKKLLVSDSISNLLLNATQIELGRNFVYSDLVFPPHITHMKFREYFDEALSILPPKLTHLIFENEFDQPFKNLFPSTLKQLVFGDCYAQVVTFPSNLTHLKLGFNQLFHNLPLKLTYLRIGNYTNEDLPSTLTHLTIESFSGITISNLPLNLKNLQFGDYFDSLIERFPPNLKELQFGIDFNLLIDNLLFPHN